MCGRGREWKRGTHEFVASRSNRKFVSILRGNPRNPDQHPWSTLSLSPSFSSKLYSSLRLLPMHLSPHSPEFLFYSLLSINVFSFPCSQNFLIISAKMRDSLSRTECDSIDFFFSVVSNIRKRSRVLTPMDWRILFTQHLITFISHCVSNPVLFFIYCTSLFLAYWSIEY